MAFDRLARLRKMLTQVDPTGASSGLKESLEGRAANTEGVGQGLDVRRKSAFSQEAEIALESLDVLRRNEAIDVEQQFTLEAIVMPYYRPVVDIFQDRIKAEQLTQKWQHLSGERLRPLIEQCQLSIGRIDVPDIPSLPYAGTGFVVGPDLMMTNRHVARIFAEGVGVKSLRFHSGQNVAIDFYREHGRDHREVLSVERVEMIHPYWDMALVRVRGLSPRRPPLGLSVVDPADLADREVVVIGYPGYDQTGDDEFQRIQNRIFRGVYYVKRLQPGVLRARRAIESFGQQVQAVTHDASTLGGNSGSAVILLPRTPKEPLQVVGLHFAGAYLDANYAVPTSDLAQDSRIVNAGVNFIERAPARDDFYDGYWKAIDADDDVGTMGARLIATEAGAVSAGPIKSANFSESTLKLTIPIEVSIAVGQPFSSSVATAGVPTVSTERLFGRQPSEPTARLRFPFSAASLAAPQFSWRMSLSLALASRLAYEDMASVVATAWPLWGMTVCRFFEVENTQCFVGSTSDVVLVAFRGTESAGDWLVDLDVAGASRSYGVVHRGFLRAFRAVEPHLMAEIEALAGRPLILTGHSLGGALAVLAAAEWKGRFDIRWIMTYGQPAVGKGSFETWMQSYSSGLVRIVNNDDIVPKVPPTYVHVGRVVRFDALGNIQSSTESLAALDGSGAPVGSEGEMMLSEPEFDRLRAALLLQRARRRGAALEGLEAPAVEGLLPSLSDHSLDAYIAKIAAKVSNEV